MKIRHFFVPFAVATAIMATIGVYTAKAETQEVAQRTMVSSKIKTFTNVNGTIQWQPILSNGRVEGFIINYGKSKSTKQQVLKISDFGIGSSSDHGQQLVLTSVSPIRKIKDNYTMLSGKRRECSAIANEVQYTFIDQKGGEQTLVVRLYDDGVAFRYLINCLHGAVIPDEHTTYYIAEGTKRWMQKWTEAYEEFFPMTETGEHENRRWGYPALIQTSENLWTLITEAGIEKQHSASCLYNDSKNTDYRVVADINNKSTDGTWQSPWRVLIIGSLDKIVESTLVTDVSAPCRVEDTLWIKPGGVSWIYWAYNHGSNDYGIIKQYVDMAVDLKLPYVLIDAEWDEMKNGKTIEDAIYYAHAKGIKPLLWYNSSTAWIKAWGAPGPHERLNNKSDREKEFAWLKKMGVAGVKIDFFAGDKQTTMEYCIDILESAAKYNLMVNFHGATTPRGWQRTYPHLMTTEGVYGAEWYNNLPILTNKAAAHNATLPFTRNVVGSMDYTPCTFSDSQHPHITSHAHELALPVLFESALLHWADRPESYLAQPTVIKDFIGTLPTTWDETKFVSGYPGESIVMARRKGNTWYVAGINGKDEEQTLATNLSFITKKRCAYRIITDADESNKPWAITEKQEKLPIMVKCKPRGGFVLIINN